MKNQTKLKQHRQSVLKKDTAISFAIREKVQFDILYARKPKNPI